MKDWVYRIRQRLAHQLCLWAVSLDMATFLNRAHLAVCHAAFKAAQAEGATGDLVVRIIVEEEKSTDGDNDEWEITHELTNPTSKTYH
jgi:hypothetical protein